MGKPYSRMNFWGDIEHFDENGKKTGESRPGFFDGEYTDYDADGNRIGTSREQLLGVGYNHYDNDGNLTGSSDESIFGGYTHRDAYGRVTGTSDRSMLDLRPGGNTNPHSGSMYRGNHPEDHFAPSVGGGCYIATCVYGSSECREVWTLRRFRDRCLARHAAGRLFIRLYYRFSPKLVAAFGGIRAVRALWKAVLDRFVQVLDRKGYGSRSSEPGE